jgi:hypothetical protein
MRETARGAVELEGEGDPAGQTGSQAKEEAQAETVSDTKDDGIRNGAREQAERAMLSAEEIIGKIEAAEHVKARTGNADSGDDMVVEVDG